MPRRSWKDLDPDTPAAPAAATPAVDAAGGAGDLEKAAALAPDSRLGSLLEERRALEDRLRNLSGMPGQDSGDAHRDARFHVPSFAQRQAEIRTWEAQRNSARPAQSTDRFGTGAPQKTLAPADPRSTLGGTPATGLGTSAISDRMRSLRQGVSQKSGAARERLLSKPRAAADKLDEMGRPLHDIGDQLKAQDRKMDELDEKLAAEGLSESERAEIRDATRIEGMDKAGALMDKANTAIGAPKKAVQKVENAWQRREQQMTGPMDKFSGYAQDRERRLSTETGGSGDLFERMKANRANALRRRQASLLQDKRDERRRERAKTTAANRRAEDNRTTK